MKSSYPIRSSILLLFAMLWLPLGQHEFLLDHWMKIGTYAIPFLLIAAFAFWEAPEPTRPLYHFRFLGLLLLIAYLVHQYEEHWIDLYGNYYAFYTFNNNFILSNLGQPEAATQPLTKAAVFMINTALVWLVGLLAILRSPRHLFPLIAMASIIVVNGLVHLLAGLVNWQYNPGLLTSVVLFVPLYFWFARYLLRSSPSYRKPLWGGILWALLAHVLMVGGLLAANWWELIPEGGYFALLVLWSLLPLALFRPAS
mgnify:CR=1 FL=1